MSFVPACLISCGRITAAPDRASSARRPGLRTQKSFFFEVVTTKSFR